MTCFVCNLPIMSHQVGLVWQGGNGVDDLLREQMEMVSAFTNIIISSIITAILIFPQDIVRGRLGCAPCGRRDSSAQITTIETSTMDDFCSSGHHGPNCAQQQGGHQGGGGGQSQGGGSDSSTRGTAGSKRRRSSLAQLTDLLRELGSGKDKYRQAVERGEN